MHEYRVTKYDPKLRNARGAYCGNDWTSVSDVGRSFDSGVLTREAYQQVEDAYVAVALAFLGEAGRPGLAVTGLETYAQHRLDFSDGDTLGPDQMERVIRAVLQEQFWCRLESADAFIHFGYDYYMYIGVPVPCPKAIELAHVRGLFVESFRSPYHDWR